MSPVLPPEGVTSRRRFSWRWLGLGYAHPGAGKAWGLVALGLTLEVLSTPPGPAPWLVLVADAPFLWLLFGGSGGRWKRWTFLYAFLHFAIGFHWLAWIHVAQVIGAALGLTPVYLFAGAAIRFLVRRRVPWLLVVPTVLVFEEMLRTVWMGGMPLPSRSLALAGSEALVASTAFFGGYGLTFLAALTSAQVAALAGVLGAPREERGRLVRRWFSLLPIPVLAGTLLFVAGRWRLDDFEARRSDGEVFSTGRRVLLAVQADVPQSLKHSGDPGLLQRVFDDHLALSRAGLGAARDAGREVALVLWPETMIPWPFLGPALSRFHPEPWENEVRILQNVQQVALAAPGPPRFLLGAIYHFRRGEERHASPYAYGTHDSLFLVAPEAVPSPELPYPEPPAPGSRPTWELGRHDKHVLVPGGEYTPLGDVLLPLRWFRNLVSVIPELDPGAADQEPFLLLDPGVGGGGEEGVRGGTVICFELLSPARCRAWRRAGAAVLLNPANYGWFGATAFRPQIRAVARLRAAETATTVVVAGNTGPTLFYDPVGRAHGRFEALDGEAAPDPEDDANTLRKGWAWGSLVVDPERTPYTSWGEIPWFALGVLVLVLGLFRVSPSG